MTTSTFLFKKKQKKQSFWRGRRGAACARASVRAAWIEVYGPLCEKKQEAERSGSGGGKKDAPPPPLVAGVAFFASPADAVDAAALSGACAALAAGSAAALSGLSPSAGASLCLKAADALWQHRDAAAVAAELAAPRGSFSSSSSSTFSPSASSTSSPPSRPFATPLAEAMMSLADPSFWLNRLSLPSQEAATAAAAALGASAGSRGGRLLARAATLLPRETPTAAAAAAPAATATKTTAPSLAAALVSNLAVRCVALGKGSAAEVDLPALLCAPSLWLRAPPLAPLAPRLCRAAALSVAAAVSGGDSGGDSSPPPAGSPSAAAALSRWLTPLLREEAGEDGGKRSGRDRRRREQRWSVRGGLGAASAALAANLASSAGRAASASPASSSSPTPADRAAAVAALCRALACLLRASPPEALGEKRETGRGGSVSGYFDAGGEEEEEDDGGEMTSDEDEEGGGKDGDGAEPMETSADAAAAAPASPSSPSSSSSSPYLPLDFASFDRHAPTPAGLSSLTDAAGFLGPLCAAALPAATAAEAAERAALDPSSDPAAAAALAAAPWALCDALLAIMALPSRRLAALAALASAGVAAVPRLWFSAARGAWGGALARAGAPAAAAAAAAGTPSSSCSAAASAAAAGLFSRDPRALSVLAVLSAAAATSFSTAAPDAPAAGRLLPLEELVLAASPPALSPSSSSPASCRPASARSPLPGGGLLDLSRDVAWSMLSGEASHSLSGAVEASPLPPSSLLAVALAARRKRGGAAASDGSGSGVDANASPVAAAALEGATSLLRILHDRNGMVPFAPEEAFHAAPLRKEEAAAGGGGGGGDGSGGLGDGLGGTDDEATDGESGEELEDGDGRSEGEDFAASAAHAEISFRGFGPGRHELQRWRGGGGGGSGARRALPAASAVAAARFRAALAGGGAPAARLRAVLRRAPCLVPFRVRAAAFVEALALDAERAAGGADALTLGGGRQGWQGQQGRHRGGGPGGGGGPPQFATVRRHHVFEDALSTLGPLPASALKGRVRVAFVDEHGMREAGVDGGGLFKEFCEALVKEAFWPRREEEEEGLADGGGGGGGGGGPRLRPPPPPPFPSLFVETASRELAPAPGAGRDRASALRLAFLGRALGKLLSEGVLVELPLARFFVKMLLGQKPDLGDLTSLDPALAASLAALRRAGAAEIEAAGLTFAVGVRGAAGAGAAAAVDVELVPGGASLPVTASNVAEFVHRAAAAHFSAAAPAAAALRSGLEDFLPHSWPRRAFSAAEFAVLLGGGRAGVSVEDMRRHTIYAGGYHRAHPTVLALWEALGAMTDAERASVLRFATASARPPLLGFSRLNPPLCVAMSGSGGANSDSDHGRLPSAATCMNLLKLPPYGSAEEVRRKLLFAASEGAGGFSLS